MVIKLSEEKGGVKEDKLAQLLGHFGRWQFLVFSTVCFVKLSTGWVQMAILFLTPNGEFWCEESNGTVDLNSTCYDHCEKYAVDSSPMETTITSEWELVCNRRWLASFTQMMLQLGILVGSIIFGFLSDRYGRKYTFLASITGVIALGLGVPFSPEYITFTILRFFLGIFTAGTMVISFVIIMETVGPKYREILGCLFQIPFIIGHMTVPLFAYYFRQWDTFCLAMAVPAVLYLGHFFLLKESPRWLLSVGRIDEATRIVEQAAVLNKLPTNNIKDTLTKMSQEMNPNTNQPKPNYSDLFRRSLRTKTLCCCVMWLTTGVTFFGFNQYISQASPDPFISVTAAGAIQLPSNFLAIWLIGFLGRKKTAIVFFILGGICAIALDLVPQVFWITLTLGTLGVSCASIVATSIYILTSELFPTVVRNMGMGACSTSMRVGSMIAPFISNLSTTYPWLPTVIFGLAPICAGFVCFALPETKGRLLPDNIEHDKSGA